VPFLRRDSRLSLDQGSLWLIGGANLELKTGAGVLYGLFIAFLGESTGKMSFGFVSLISTSSIFSRIGYIFFDFIGVLYCFSVM
jgi:hypothetical protein